MLDPAIIARAQNGDPQAFRQIVEAYQVVAWKTARVLLRDSTLAEDIVQDAWIDIWRGLPRLQQPLALRSWLLTIVANRCRMTARRSGLATVSHDSTPEIDSVAAGHDDTLDHMVQLETAADVHLAVEALPAAQRRVLELRYFAELELGEIALVVGVPLGTVKSRVNRALQSLRNSQHIKQESHIV